MLGYAFVRAAEFHMRLERPDRCFQRLEVEQIKPKNSDTENM